MTEREAEMLDHEPDDPFVPFQVPNNRVLLAGLCQIVAVASIILLACFGLAYLILMLETQ